MMTHPPVHTPPGAGYDADVSTTPPSGPPPAPAKASVWEDFLDIFYAPSAVFARRERGSVWIPMLVVTVLIGTFFTLNSGMLEPMMDAEFRRSMAAAAEGGGPRPTTEQLDQIRAFGATMGKIMAFASMPIAILLVGAALWFAGKLVSARQTFHAALVVTAYAYMPKVLESLLVSVQGLLLDTSTLTGRFQLTFGIGRFLDPDTTSPVLLALLGRVDVFTLWVTVLLAIGLAVTGRVSKAQAAIAAAVVWLVGALPTVLPALRG
jgi:hypothetical protein